MNFRKPMFYESDVGHCGPIYKDYWVETVGWANTDQWSCRITDYDPTGDVPISYYDTAAGARRSANRHIFKVRTQDGIVTGLTVTKFDCNCNSCTIKYGESISVGDRFPNEN